MEIFIPCPAVPPDANDHHPLVGQVRHQATSPPTPASCISLPDTNKMVPSGTRTYLALAANSVSASLIYSVTIVLTDPIASYITEFYFQIS